MKPGSIFLKDGTRIDRLETISCRKPPNASEIQLTNGVMASHARILLKLPGASVFTDLGEQPVVEHVVRFPLPLVFVAFATENEGDVAAVVRRLNNDGIMTWFRPDQQLPGARWENTIDEAIDTSDFFAPFLTDLAVKKTGDFQRELRQALRAAARRPESARFVVPILLEACKVPRDLALFDWVEVWREGEYDRLLKGFRAPAGPH